MVSADMTPFFDLAPQLAVLNRHGNTIAGADSGCITNHLRAIPIPAHGVAAREHGQRTQAFEPRDGRTEPRIECMAFAVAHGREPALAGDEPGSRACEPSPQVERLER